MDYDPPPEDEPGVCERLRLIEPVEKSKVEKRLHEWTFGNAEEDMSAWLDLFGTNSPGSLRVDVDAAVTTGEVFELVNQEVTRVLHAKVAAKAVARAADVAAVAAANAAIASAAVTLAGVTLEKAAKQLLVLRKAEIEAKALVAEAGKLVGKEAWTSPREIDFGDGVGVRRVWLLDNPDVPTCAEALGVSEMSSRFGTDPGVWNLLFGAMKSLPRSLLADRQKMQSLSLFSEPIIRVVDRLVGATNAMRVDAYSPGDASPTLTLRCAHRDLEQCVGQATAAFGLELLQGNVPPGVWYPAELGDEPRANILERAREDAFVWEM